MSGNNFGFEELELWKKVRAFKKKVCSKAKKFPVEERVRLTDQVTRISPSINSLIPEGHGRFTYPDQIHHCVQARRSLAETINHLIDAFDGDILQKKN